MVNLNLKTVIFYNTVFFPVNIEKVYDMVDKNVHQNTNLVEPGGHSFSCTGYNSSEIGLSLVARVTERVKYTTHA